MKATRLFSLAMLTFALGSSAAIAKAVTCAREALLAVPEPLTIERHEARRQTLLKAMLELNAWLERSGAQRGADWRRYLSWEVLESNVKLGIDGDTKALRRILESLYQPYAGLELPRFVAVRDGLRGYVAATELIASSNQEARIAAKLAFVRQLLANRDLVDLSLEETDQLGKLKAWLADAGQASHLVDCIDRGFAYGNVAFRVDARVLRQLLDENYDVVTPVSEYSFGAYVQGHARTRAHTSILLVPNAKIGDVRIAARGRTIVNTTSSQSRVYVNTTLVSDFLVSKRLHFDDRIVGGAFGSYPTVPQVVTRGTVNSVYSDRIIGRRIAERIGWRRAHEILPHAEARASQRVGRQVGQRLEARLNQVLRNANLLYEEFLGGPLRRIGFGSLRPSGQTTSNQFLATLRLAKFDQLSAPSAPPSAPASQDLQLSVHETVAVNALDDFLGARTVEARQVEAFVREVFGSVPKALETGPGIDGYDFAFAKENPVQLRFRDQQVKVRVLIDEFTRRAVDPSEPPVETYEGALVVEATYRLRVTKHVVLERVGDPSTTFMAPVSARLEAFARAKLSAMLAPELKIDSLEIRPNRLLSRGATLAFGYGVATNGWLALGAHFIN